LRKQDRPAVKNGFVEGPRFDEALEVLGDRRFLYLRGLDGSGRRATATAALDFLWEARAIQGIVGFELAADEVRLADFLAQQDIFPRERGIVIEVSGADVHSGSTLDACRSLATRLDGYLVLLGWRSGTGDMNVGPYAVTHEAPPPGDILKRRLRLKLSDEGLIDAILRDRAVIDHLERYRRPEQVVSLAQALVRGVNQGRTAAEVVEGMLPDPREVARFEGLPLSDVLDAAELLLALLRSAEAPDSSPARRVFGDDLENLLHPEMRPSAEGRTETPRRARLHDPKLAGAMLDVAWNDYDITSTALLIWFDQLVWTGRPAVRARAAVAVGKLATFDFEKVMAELIRPWGMSAGGVRRQAAAWALEFAVGDPRFEGRIHARVAEWARGPNSELHDSAARVWGTSLGASDPVAAMKELRLIAADPTQRPYRSIGKAVAGIFSAKSAAEVLDLLGEWLAEGSPHVVSHAAWALVFLAREPGASPQDRWPLLLRHCPPDEAGHRLPARLWTTALTDAATAFPAWELLRQWIELACEGGDGLADAVSALAVETLADPRLTRRADWHLRLWHMREPNLALFGRLRDLLKKG
jgi:hypothetical protein